MYFQKSIIQIKLHRKCMLTERALLYIRIGSINISLMYDVYIYQYLARVERNEKVRLSRYPCADTVGRRGYLRSVLSVYAFR